MLESQVESSQVVFESTESGARKSSATWRQVDARLRVLAARRAALDLEEARWLVVARRTEVHLHFGFATLLEYLERVLGYGPHAASERLRVAEALEILPATREALATGRLAFSAVRELTRVMTPFTEKAWLAAAEGRSLRELEPLVVGRRRGDLPGAPPEPSLVRHVVRFEVKAATLALLRDARIALDDEAGERLDDDALIAALCRAALGGGDRAEQGRANYQIAVTTCDQCDRAWQDGGGAAIEVTPDVVGRARCDAQHVGRLDAAIPDRAVQDVPPAVRRLVWRRDHGTCVVPGCRSARHLELHHIVPRAEGGSHTADNCCLLCTAHHTALHEGRLAITGTMSAGLNFAHADGRPYGAPPPLASPDQPDEDIDPRPRAEAIQALRRLGFTAAEARGAVDEVQSHVGPEPAAMTLIEGALRAIGAAATGRPGT